MQTGINTVIHIASMSDIQTNILTDQQCQTVAGTDIHTYSQSAIQKARQAYTHTGRLQYTQAD